MEHMEELETMTNPYDDIRRERVRQDAQHGPRLDVNDIPRVLGEEFGEVCKAINDREHVSRVREELVQCAAVCLKAIESIDRGDAMPPSERSGFACGCVGDTRPMFTIIPEGAILQVNESVRIRRRADGFPSALLVKGGDE